MTQYSTDRQQTLQAIQKQHEELLRQNDGSAEFVKKEVQPFLEIIAQAGKSIENPQERSWLRDFIGYWSDIVNEKTGELPVVPLEPFDLSQVPRRSNLNFRKLIMLLVAILALIIIIISFAIFSSFPSFILHPSPTPTPRPTQSFAFQCPTPLQVSAWMNVVVSQVTRLLDESCAFRIYGHGALLSGVICTKKGGDTTIEYAPVGKPKTLVVRDCDGNQIPDIGELTIRFVSGYPRGDASVCAIVQKERTRHHDWTFEPPC